MNILFIGDIVGQVGRRMVKEKLSSFVDKYQIDFVIANGENVTHGLGLIRNHYEQLIASGVDAVTLGNHYDAKNEIRRYIDSTDRLIRPANLIKDYPGEGTILFDLNGVTIRVTNLLGVSFMKEEVKSPYQTLMDIIDNEEKATIHIVDYHGEATGEKKAFCYAVDGMVSAVIGTHTHVQTRDYQILDNGTAYISDVGMTGAKDGVLGFSKETVVAKNIFGKQVKFEPVKEGRGLFSAVVIQIDEISGKAKQIFPIYYVEDN